MISNIKFFSHMLIIQNPPAAKNNVAGSFSDITLGKLYSGSTGFITASFDDISAACYLTIDQMNQNNPLAARGIPL